MPSPFSLLTSPSTASPSNRARRSIVGSPGERTHLPADERYAEEYLRAHEEVVSRRLSVLRSLERGARWPPLCATLGVLVGAGRTWGSAPRRTRSTARASLEPLGVGGLPPPPSRKDVPPSSPRKYLVPSRKSSNGLIWRSEPRKGCHVPSFQAVHLSAWLRAGWVVDEGDKIRCAAPRAGCGSMPS